MIIAPTHLKGMESKRVCAAHWIVWTLLLLLSSTTWAIEPDTVDIVIPSAHEVINLSKHAALLEDRDQVLTIDEITSLPDARWRHVSKEALQVAYTRTTWWIRVFLTNSESLDTQRILEVRSPLIDFLDVYLMDGVRQIREYAVGDQRPISARPLMGRTFNFPIDIPAHTTRQILIRLSLKDGVFDMAPLLLWSQAAFSDMQYREPLLLGIFFGSILALTIYNLLLFYTSRDSNFIRYALLLGTLAVWNFGYRGLGYLYLWPDHPWVNNLLGMVLPTLMFILASRFVTNFLETRKRTPRIHRLIICVTWMLPIPAAIMGADILGVEVPIVAAFNLLIVQMFILTLSYIGAGVLIYRQGYRPAGFFLLAWFCLAFGVWIYLLSTLSVDTIPVSFWTENAVAIGSILEIHLLGLGLGYRYKLLRDQNAVLEAAAYRTHLRQNFLDTIAHELRTPLTVIQTTTENLSYREKRDDDEALRRYEKILRAAERMSGLISGYLDEGGSGLARDQNLFEVCHVRKLLEDASASATIHLYDHQMVIEVSKSTPPFVCDSRLTALALRNLADNAIKYSPRGSTIRLKGGCSPQGAWFEVENEGCGITKIHLDRIFEPGYRISDLPPGTGFGLTLARRVIEQQGGTLTVRLLKDERCSFRIDLPIRSLD